MDLNIITKTTLSREQLVYTGIRVHFHQTKTNCPLKELITIYYT